MANILTLAHVSVHAVVYDINTRIAIGYHLYN